MKTVTIYFTILLAAIQVFSQKKRGAGLAFDDALYEKTPIAESFSQQGSYRFGPAFSLKNMRPLLRIRKL
ncbi:MAG: hypothetical protein R3B93_13665 [Bacteroidia bacterium]